MSDQASQSAVNPAALRATLRRRCIALRMALPAHTHAQASRHILDCLQAFLLPWPRGVIAFCAALRGEVDCQPLIETLLAGGWQAAMPVVIDRAFPMVFRPWTPDAAMTVDPHGIPVPDTTESVVPDIVLLPLVAFDQAGYRLGYGGGYFDRTLAAASPRPLAVGVGFACCEVDDICPENHDMRLDFVVTEHGLRQIEPA